MDLDLKSIAVVFTHDGISFDTDRFVEGLDAVVQNALINLLTAKNTDATAPDRGTNLFKDGVRQNPTSIRQMQHLANFAATDTLHFSRNTDPETNDDSLAAVQLRVSEADLGVVDLDLSFTSVDGRVIGDEILPIGN
jgi:hypothetical protein